MVGKAKFALNFVIKSCEAYEYGLQHDAAIHLKNLRAEVKKLNNALTVMIHADKNIIPEDRQKFKDLLLNPNNNMEELEEG